MTHCAPWIALAFALAACKSDVEKMCFDSKSKDVARISACGELCDKGDQKACGTQGEIALERCMKDKDAETCRWMCNYGKDGKDLYCKEHATITGKPAQ